MRAGIIVNVTPANRRRLEAIVADCSAPQKHVWRANVILATARRLRHRRDHAPLRQIEARRVALAGSVHGRRCRRIDARQRASPESRRYQLPPCSGSSIWRSGRRRAKQPTGPAGCWPTRRASACSVQRILAGRNSRLPPNRRAAAVKEDIFAKEVIRRSGAALGRTATSRASTPAFAMSCSTARSSTLCARPRSSSRAGDATAHLNTHLSM
jgi:hypothetical protein